MPAKFHQVGEAASDSERLALRFLVEGLPDDYTVYGNPWIVQRGGPTYEVDAVVVGENAVYVVEIKGYHGRISGDENEWDLDGRFQRSPVKLNRKTAQILKTELQRKNGEARRIWVQGFVFLSQTEQFHATSAAARDLVYTRSKILGALRNAALVHRLSGGFPARRPSATLAADLEALLRGADRGRRPRRTLDGYEILGVYDHTERYSELHVRHKVSGTERLLRYYEIQPLASDDEIENVRKRVRWTSDVFAGLNHRHILRTDPFDKVEGGFVLPMEYFQGLSLKTWIERYEEELRDDVPARVKVWSKMVGALRHAHGAGVVHRLLRPEVVQLDDTADDPDLRVGGFELAKRLSTEETVSWTAVGDERLHFAAPEVLNAFSDAGPESDQFSLGALLGFLLAGRPLFENTLAYMQTGRLVTRPSDFYSRTPGALDDAVVRMLALRAPDRFPSLDEAEDAVVRALEPRARRPAVPRSEPLDPDDLAPGVTVGDFDVVGKLGEGGLAVVYAATHHITNSLRALKVARPSEEAENALKREHEILEKLRHPGIVKVSEPSGVILPGRLTLVMEHVEGRTLRQWLQEEPDADVNTRHRFAEDLLAALEYLEQQGVTHNDLKPDNLLVGKGGLRVIDFSLARDDEGEAALGGTARYRDVMSHVWSHATDRYAAALCLFELFVGRHAFGGRVRELDEELAIDESEVEPAGLADFFRAALHHEPRERPTSGHKLREELREALGGRRDEAPPATAAEGDVTENTGVHVLALSNRAVNALRRAGAGTIGEMLALSERQIRAMHAVGRTTAGEILRVQEELREKGLGKGIPERHPAVRPALFPELEHDGAPVFDLPGVSENFAQALTGGGLGTVGRLAGASRDTVLAVPGVGPTRAARLLEALRRRYRGHEEGPPRLTGDLWQRAAAPLGENQREIFDRVVGVTGPPTSQAALARELDKSRERVRQVYNKAYDKLDLTVLDEPASVLETLLDGLGGLVPLATAAERLESEWLPSGGPDDEGAGVDGRGLVRLLVAIDSNPFRLHSFEQSDEQVLTRVTFDESKTLLKGFEKALWGLVESWPPVAAEVAAGKLRDALPGFAGDPAGLAVRLFPDVHQMAGGELFLATCGPRLAVELVLERASHRLTVDGLVQDVDDTFGGVVRCPEEAVLREWLHELRYEVDDEGVVVPVGEGRRSIQPRDVHPAWEEAPTPAQEVEAALKAASRSRGFRIVLAPPEKHREIGRSVAKSLDAPYVSFEDRWFEKHAPEIDRMLRAERFVAQRKRLTRSADELLDEIVVEGRKGDAYVLGDTALLGTLDAVENVRYLYDLTLSGEHGFWVLVIPGRFAERRQPLFNNKKEVWHLEGIVVQLEEPLA